MKLLFVDFIPWDYDALTPYQAPLGGSQSCMCYLAAGLARRGHEVTMMTGTKQPREVLGVRCLNINQPVPLDLVQQPPDVVIVLNGPAEACAEVRKVIAAPTPLVLWNQHAPDQRAMSELSRPEIQAGWDAIVCMSDHHRDLMLIVFGIEAKKLEVIRNGMAPAFEGLFRDEADLAAAKRGPPVLAFTSTPFRGLDVLLHVFPQAKQQFPDLELDVFSSMQVYQHGPDKDTYGAMYQTARSLPGVRYVGSVAQPALACQLRRASILAYPSTFAEMFCISVVEAMAAGTFVLTSDLGALPETMGPHGRLVPRARDASGMPAFAAAYLGHLCALLQERRENPQRFGAASWPQVQDMNARFSWSARIVEWEASLARWRKS
jgi:glycosyltransferase involved in cell wall biosynthesis